MNQERATYLVRAGGCAALLALLAVCGYAGAKQPAPLAVSVPVMLETIDRGVLSAGSMQEIAARLDDERKAALSQLQAVADNPGASAETRNAALAEIAGIAGRREKEASLCAVFAHMGFGDTAAVVGDGSVNVIVPWQVGENEQSRMQLIDAAVTQTGLSADCVKIILSKK